MARLLVVEDDEWVRQVLEEHLRLAGHDVASVGTVTEGVAALGGTPSIEVLLLDLTLPDGSGLDVLDHVVAMDSPPHVIVLSGAGTEPDRVSALESGADDFVVKPFSVREVAARIGAVVRRQTRLPSRLVYGALSIDVVARQVTVNGAPADVPAKEFDLLAYLAARPGHVFTRDELLRAVWRSEPEWQQVRTVTEHVRRLRVKLEKELGLPRMLFTIRGVGYRFGPSEDERSAARSGVVTHVAGRIVEADADAAALAGAQSERDLIGREIFEFVAPHSLPAAMTRQEEIMQGRWPGRQRLSLMRLDGGEVLVEVTSEPTDWSGQPASRNVLTRVNDSADVWRSVLGTALTEVSDAVIVTDVDRFITGWNEAAERLYGWRAEEVIGRQIGEVLPWDGETQDTATARRVLFDEGRWFGFGTHLTRDGQPLRIAASTTVLRSAEGDSIGVVSVNRESTMSTAEASPSTATTTALAAAIEHDEFQPHFQSVVSLRSGAVVAVEALARWNHPERGLLAPDQFLPDAERTGLVTGVGNAILRQACRCAAEWRRHVAPVEVAVNLSARQLAAETIVSDVRQAVEEAALDASALWLEVTETALVEDLVQAGAKLRELAELGVRVAIDDFGTGWASLTYLQQFPVHALKIDRSFVSGVVTSPRDAAIARSVIALGVDLGLDVVAEGVETSEQADALRAMGCPFGQGYFFGRPVDGETMTAALSGRP